MGLIKAVTSSISSGLGDQFKEYITCPTMEKGTLIQRGVVEHGRGNRKPTEGVISNGSRIDVPEGAAMMIIENGAIKEFTAEVGSYTFDTSAEPSIFTGGLGKGIVDTIKTIGSRITFGGQAARDQRVYYINILPILENNFGSPSPVPLEDPKYKTIEVTFFGSYSIKVIDPALLVTEVLGTNPKDTVLFSDIEPQLKQQFIQKITTAISFVLNDKQVTFKKVQSYTSDITTHMNTVLDEIWGKKYGIEILDVALPGLRATEESVAFMREIDAADLFSDPNRQAGLMAKASADAMKAAASNESGAMMGFMGMGMAQGQGANLIGAVNQNVQQQGAVPQDSTPAAPVPGTVFEGEEKAFCPDCGTPRKGKFCSKCGRDLG